MPASNEKPIAPENFESALGRLENIVHRMEVDRLPLDELISSYEEGTRLVKVCSEFLKVAEQKIELLARSGEADATLVPFDSSKNSTRNAGSSEPSQSESAAPGHTSPSTKSVRKDPTTVGSNDRPSTSSSSSQNEVSLF